MTEFIFETLSQRSTTYDGPSGTRYVIYKGQPFKVDIAEDIAFFKNNNRFSELGIIKKILKPKPVPEPDVDMKLREKLSKLKGLNKKTIDKVVELYLSEKQLTDTIEGRYKLDPSIPKKHQEIIKKYILKGDKK